MARLFLLFLPVFTFMVPARFFGFYMTLVCAVAAYVAFMFTVLTDASKEAFAEFGVEVTFGYIALNLALVGVRYALIRRARARILKLPAPKE